MSPRSGPGFLASLPQAGLVTRCLCGILVAVSLLGVIAQRTLGFGVADLIYDVAQVLIGHQFWRVITYVFVKTTPFGLLLSTVVLWLFGRSYESAWGARDFLRFFFATTVGAALLIIPFHWLLAHLIPFLNDLGVAEGPDVVVDALLVAMVLNAPDSNILFGFVLPMKARTLLYILPGIDIISGIMQGATTLSTTLAGLCMGYFLVTGNWRLSRLRNLMRRRRRGGLYVVPPKNKHQYN